jgi:hypothetical protein
MNRLKQGIIASDLLADKPALRLHFEGKREHKSFLGGCCSICMILIFIGFALIVLFPVIYTEKPE